MRKLQRFTALATLAAFLGLSALEAFHTHTGLQTETNCSVCQIAHKTPSLVTAVSIISPQWISTEAYTVATLPSYVQFLFVSQGLSPPTL